MGYETTFTRRWTVTHIDKESGEKLELQKDDVLEFIGDGGGGEGNILKRHRDGAATIDWGDKCNYVSTPIEKISGEHLPSERENKFELTFPVMQIGYLTKNEGGSTGGQGSWTAQEGG